MDQNKPDFVVSLCASLHNSAASVEGFLCEATAELSALYRYYEIVLVDDQSTDGGHVVVENLLKTLPNIRLVRLSRAHGDEIARGAALDHCIGDYVVLLDMNWDPVSVVPSVVSKLVEGRDVVIGRHRQPRGSRTRRAISRIVRRAVGAMLGTTLDTNTGSCLGFSRRAVNSLTRIASNSRFILYDSRLVGFCHTIFDYDQVLRAGGRLTEESMWVAARTRIEMVVARSMLPLRIATFVGVLASFGNLLYLLYILAVVIFKRRIAEGWLTTSFTQTIMFLCLFIILAIVSEYIGRVLAESKGQPRYFLEHESSSTVSCYDKNRLNIV